VDISKWINSKRSTNGTLINEEIVKFIKEYKVFLSISLDGDKHTHDKNRIFINGNGTYDKLLKNIETLKDVLGKLFNTYVSFWATLCNNCDYILLPSIQMEC
jgi:uncharacterized protein